MIDKMTHLIQQAIPGAIVRVSGDDGRHYEAVVISEQFAGLSLIKQHQLVMNALKDEFQEMIHALQLKTFTPEAWQQHHEQR